MSVALIMRLREAARQDPEPFPMTGAVLYEAADALVRLETALATATREGAAQAERAMKAERERDEANAAVDEAAKHIASMKGDAIAARYAQQQAESRLTALENLANRYARHDADCDVSPNHPIRCRCGYLEAAMRALAGAKPQSS
jgi:multidrug efflux pump subunit AcrA (membrane-fusion protein)